MPTIHQLIKKKRKKDKKRSKTPALAFGFNVLKNRPRSYSSPYKKGVCLKVFSCLRQLLCQLLDLFVEPVKPGWQTTEFWVTMAGQVIGIVALLGYITIDQQSVLIQAATQIGGVIVMVGSAFGYALSRGLAKK